MFKGKMAERGSGRGGVLQQLGPESCYPNGDDMQAAPTKYTLG